MARISGWPVKLEAAAQLPSRLARELGDRLATGETLEQLLYVSLDSRSQWERTRGSQVLALTDRRVLVGAQGQRRRERAWAWVALPYDSVVGWATGERLLYAWVDIFGQADGLPDSPYVRARMEYNTVGRDMVQEALAPLLRATLGDAGPSRQNQAEPPLWASLSLKFYNILRETLLSSERVLDMAYQPVILEPRLGLWQRLVAPPSLVASTSLRLLVILDQWFGGKTHYGSEVITLPKGKTGEWSLSDYEGHVRLCHRAAPQLWNLACTAERRSTLEGLLAMTGNDPG